MAAARSLRRMHAVGVVVIVALLQWVRPSSKPPHTLRPAHAPPPSASCAASLIALKPTPGKGEAPPLVLAQWARQALCAAATTAGGCQAVDSSSRCFWDAKKVRAM